MKALKFLLRLRCPGKETRRVSLVPFFRAKILAKARRVI
jgi:hypothetical protein